MAKNKKIKAAGKSAAKKSKENIETLEERIAKQIGIGNVSLYYSQEEIALKEAALTRDRNELSEEKEKIEEKIKQANEQKSQAGTILAKAREKEKESDKREKEIAKKESLLKAREREILARELNAEKEFEQQNNKAMESLKDEVDKLKEEKNSIVKENSSKKRELEAELLEYEEQQKQKTDEKLRNFYKEKKKEYEENEEKDLNEKKKELEEKEYSLLKREDEIKKHQKKLVSIENDIRYREEELEYLKRECIEDKKREIEKINNEKNGEIEKYKADTEFYKHLYENQMQELENFRKQEAESGGKSRLELIEENESYKRENQELKNKILNMPSEEKFNDYRIKAENYENALNTIKDLQNENMELKVQADNYFIYEKNIEILENKIKLKNKHLEVLEATIEKYSEEVSRYKSLYEQPKKLEGRLDTVLSPYMKKTEFSNENLKENEWLKSIKEKCFESGIVYSMRLLKAFHTALKTQGWSPLTVLEGASGTGKSTLPQYYCRYGGIYFIPVSVASNWDSSQELFGYFNSVDNKYNATVLIRALIQAAPYSRVAENVQQIFKDKNAEEYLNKMQTEENNLNDSVFLVLLDEMNLAYVEEYLSELLSGFEIAKNTDKNAEIDIDLGAGIDKFRLEISDNVLWTGTLNRDETTKTLSDKVIDRGNIINFSVPKEYNDRIKQGGVDAALMLPQSQWNEWKEASVIDSEKFMELIEPFKRAVEAVNEALNFAHRTLGHRVWQSIEHYMANHPDVIEVFNSREFSKSKAVSALKKAFEEAAVFKIMPKLNGIETDGESRTKCLNKIKDILFKGKNAPAEGIKKDFENALNNPDETFLWCSADYLFNE